MFPSILMSRLSVENIKSAFTNKVTRNQCTSIPYWYRNSKFTILSAYHSYLLTYLDWNILMVRLNFLMASNVLILEWWLDGVDALLMSSRVSFVWFPFDYSLIMKALNISKFLGRIFSNFPNLCEFSGLGFFTKSPYSSWTLSTS
jgi:hypothetical protein